MRIYDGPVAPRTIESPFFTGQLGDVPELSDAEKAAAEAYLRRTGNTDLLEILGLGAA